MDGITSTWSIGQWQENTSKLSPCDTHKALEWFKVKMPFHRIEKQIWQSIFLNLSIQYFWVEQVTKRGTTAGNTVLLNVIWVSLYDIQFSKEANH